MSLLCTPTVRPCVTPLRRRSVRVGIGLAEAAVLLVFAFVLFEPGPLRWATLATAAFVAVTTPLVLGLVARSETEPAV